mgnify:FL=1
MANIRKSFNLRNGLQVDEDNLLVNSVGNVGLGTTVPEETLDIRGNAQVIGVVTATDAYISGSFESVGFSTLTTGSIGRFTVTGGIATATSGVVTYYGDGARLSNLPTSQWEDVDVGLGFTSIYNKGFVGISTVDPRFTLQIGGNNDLTSFTNGVGINSSGNMVVTGIITAATLKGEGSDITAIDADNIATGTLSTDRYGTIPNGKLGRGYEFAGVTTSLEGFIGNVTGNVVGFASTAHNLVDGLALNQNTLIVNSVQTGILTVTSLFVSPNDTASVGVGTTNPQADVHTKRSGISTIQISSDNNASTLTLSRGLAQEEEAGAFRFGNASAGYPYSNSNSLDILNYSTGNINQYLHTGPAGINTGSFHWLHKANNARLMSLTYGGSLGIGITVPTNTLHVVGTSTVTGNAFIGNDLSIAGDLNLPAGSFILSGTVSGGSGLKGNILADNNELILENGVTKTAAQGLFNINVTTGLSTFRNALFSTTIGIGTAAVGGGNIIHAQGGATEFVGRRDFAVTSDGFVGAGQTTPECIADFSGIGNTHRHFMRVPTIANNTVRAQVNQGIDDNPAGGLVYNQSVNKFQFWNGSAWETITSS